MGNITGLPQIAVRKERVAPTGPMTKPEAVDWANDVRNKADRFIDALKKGHDRRAWVALGYTSWEACCAKEFRITRQRAYQLLGQAEVAQALTEAVRSALPPGAPPVAVVPISGSHTDVSNRPSTSTNDGFTPTVIPVTEPEARAIKPHLDEAVADVRRSVSHGGSPATAVQRAVRKVRGEKPPKPAKVMPKGEQLAFVFDEAETVLAMAKEPTPENFALLRETLRHLIDQGRTLTVT